MFVRVESFFEFRYAGADGLGFVVVEFERSALDAGGGEEFSKEFVGGFADAAGESFQDGEEGSEEFCEC